MQGVVEAAAPVQRTSGKGDPVGGVVGELGDWRRIVVGVLLVVVTAPALLPLLHRGFAVGQDGFEHAFRVLAIQTALQHGVLLPRWVPELAGGFGYPLFAVYGPLAYYLPALFALGGVSIFGAIKLDLALLLLASGLGAYLVVRPYAGRTGGLVAAACYVCGPYTLADAYVRLDLAELSTFPLTALALAGVLRLEWAVGGVGRTSAVREGGGSGNVPAVGPRGPGVPSGSLPRAARRSIGDQQQPIVVTSEGRPRGAAPTAGPRVERRSVNKGDRAEGVGAGGVSLDTCQGTRRRAGVLSAISTAALPLALLAATHTISLVTFLPTLGAVLGFVVVGSWRRLGAPWRALVALASTGALAFCLAAWFLLPALQWQGWVRLTTIPSDEHFIPKLLDLPGLVRSWGSVRSWQWFAPGSEWWAWSVAPGKLGELPAGPAHVTLLAAVAAPVLAWRRRSARRGLITALAVGAVGSALLDTSWLAPLWAALPRLTQLQFPWRFMGPLSLDVALLAGLGVAELPRRARRVAAVLLVGAAVVPVLLFVRPAYEQLDASAVNWPAQVRRELAGGFGTTGSGLFLPRWVGTAVPGMPVSGAQTGLEADTPLKIGALRLDGTGVSLDYSAAAPATLMLARLFAPPWRATVDGRSVTVTPQPGTGLQQVALPAGEHHLDVRLRPTALTMLGYGLTLLTVVVVLGLALSPHPPRAGTRSPNSGGEGRISGGPSETKRRQVARGGLVWKWAAVGLGGVAGTALLVMVVGLRGDGADGWVQSTQAAGEGPIGVVAWRQEASSAWGDPPALEVVYQTTRAVVADEDVVVQLRDGAGAPVAERRQRPRLGTYSTEGWPAGLLVDDHLLLPGPALPCPGTYGAAVGFVPRGDSAEPVFQQLGRITLGGGTSGCQAMQSAANGPLATASLADVVGVGPGKVPSLTPGEELGVTLHLRTLRPSADDDTIVLRLLDAHGQEVARGESNPNLDLMFSSLWRPDGVATLRQILAVPAGIPPGVYRLAVGLYSSARAVYDPIAAPSEPVTTGMLPLATYKVTASPGPAGAVQATFGGLFGLTGVTIEGERDGTFVAGQMVTVVTHWRMDTPTAQDYTLFVQALGANGKLVAQADGPPMDGDYPTSVWDVGETVTDQRTLTLPATLAPGRYRLIAGWYLPTTSARLPVAPARPGDAEPIGDITVTSR